MWGAVVIIFIILLKGSVWAAEPPDSIRHLRELVDERDRLYTERDNARKQAVDAALTAAKEQTASSFAASKEAIQKADTAQKEYNDRSNEFRAQLGDQAKRLATKDEVNVLVKNLEDRMTRIEADVRINRESISNSMGKGQGMSQFWDYLVVIIGLVLGIFGAMWALRSRKGINETS